MKEIIIKTQKQLDKLKRVEKDERVYIQAELKLNCKLEVFGFLRVDTKLDCSWMEGRYAELRENASAVLRGNASAELRENASAVLRGNASAVLRENASAVLRGNASAELRENASAELWGKASAELWGNASAELRENASAVLRGNASAVLRENASAELWGKASAVLREKASAELWENASAVAWDYAVLRVWSAFKLSLHGFSVLFKPFDLKIKFSKTKNILVQNIKPLNWFENNGFEKSNKYILFKKVSKEFKTQEGTKNETLWKIGDVLDLPVWNPEKDECGEGKYHAVSRPYFADEFRSNKGDRYIAIEVQHKDLFPWPKPQYPHKIAFRKCKVLYEVDRFGKKIT